MGAKRMYAHGAVYTSIQEFIADYYDSKLVGPKYAFFNHKLMHVNFVGGMHLNSLIAAIDKGFLFHAIKTGGETNGVQSESG